MRRIVLASLAALLATMVAGTHAATTAPATQPSRVLGIRIQDENHYPNAAAEIKAFGGNLVVNQIRAGSRAEQMGFQIGDAIKRINGVAVATGKDVQAAVRSAEHLKIDIVRNHQTITLSE